MEARSLVIYPSGLPLQTLKKVSSPSGSPVVFSMRTCLLVDTWTLSVEYSNSGGGGSFSNTDKTGLGSTMEIGSVHTMVWRFPVTESRRLIVPWKDSI